HLLVHCVPPTVVIIERATYRAASASRMCVVSESTKPCTFEILTFPSGKSARRRLGLARLHSRPLLRNLHHAHRIDEAIGEYEIAGLGDVRIAHDVAPARNSPALELLGLRIEANDRVGFDLGFAVPDDALDRRDAVGRGLWPAW